MTHAGKISNELADAKVQAEFLAYKASQINLPSRAEQDFEKALAESVKTLEKKHE